MDINDSPIRRKVGLNALDPGKVLKTPPKTQAEVFRDSIVHENLTEYGPISKNVTNAFNSSKSIPVY